MLNVSSLAQHYQENANELLPKVVLGAPILSSGFIRIESAVKDRRKINFFENNIVYQIGDCVKSFSGSTNFTQKWIEVTKFTDRSEDCLADFESKYLSETLSKGTSIYSEADYPSVVADNINALYIKHIGQTLWRGMTDSIADNNMNSQVSGWLYKLKNDYSSATTKAPAFTGQTPTASNADDILCNMIDNLHADIADLDLVAYVPKAAYSKIKEQCRTKYQFTFDSSSNMEFEHPLHGNVIVRRDPSMGNTKNMIITVANNLIYGCDGVSAEDGLYIQEDANKRGNIIKETVFKIGTEVAFPEYVGIYSWA